MKTSGTEIQTPAPPEDVGSWRGAVPGPTETARRAVPHSQLVWTPSESRGREVAGLTTCRESEGGKSASGREGVNGERRCERAPSGYVDRIE